MRHNIAMMEVVKAQARDRENAFGNQLPKGRHKAQVRRPVINEHALELGRLDAPAIDRDSVFSGHFGDPLFFDLGVDMAPEADIGVRERLLGIVTGKAGDGDVVGERFEQELAEDMVAPVKAAEDRHADFLCHDGRMGGGGLVREQLCFLPQDKRRCIHVRFLVVQRATNCGD